MQRRTVLQAALAGGGTALAGCLGRLGAGGSLPDECPVSRNLDVEWPDDVDRSTVESFVAGYEAVYYREVVLEYEPETPLDEYALGVSVRDGPTAAGDGFRLTVVGGGGIYEPNLMVVGEAADAPDGVEPHPADRLDGALFRVVEEAAGPREESDRYVTDRERVADHVGTVNDLLDGGGLSGRGDAVELYVVADGTTVRLSVAADGFHGDYGWRARYYVDEHVLRRTDDEDADPADGELLECRTDP